MLIVKTDTIMMKIIIAFLIWIVPNQSKIVPNKTIILVVVINVKPISSTSMVPVSTQTISVKKN